MFILLSFVYPCINIIKYITTEKEKQLKEAMKIMGLGALVEIDFTSNLIYVFPSLKIHGFIGQRGL